MGERVEPVGDPQALASAVGLAVGAEAVCLSGARGGGGPALSGGVASNLDRRDVEMTTEVRGVWKPPIGRRPSKPDPAGAHNALPSFYVSSLR